MKLAEAIPTKNIEACTTADVLVRHVFSHIGVPEEIINDQGSILRLPVDIIYRYSTDSIQETQRRCVKHLLQIMRSRLIQATILPAIPGCEREKLQNPEQTTDGKLRRLLIGPSHVVKVIGPVTFKAK
ncbi:hypothetical protein T01_12907 [Trichinella spiralis]|uniref:Integrase catalytic domain-containing protein n=1 Tax=Trichinella spiralis TaxID=6334 RepID=A0A0V1ANP6_TRISP|nr:hypothetical protein T01_12907 [Trichinella spiralis]